MAFIKILNGPSQDQQITIKGGEICGRDPSTEIQIYAAGVSRRHFQFVNEKGRIALQDLGSANGTYVNNIRISKHMLNNKDLIIVGGIHLEFGDQTSDHLNRPDIDLGGDEAVDSESKVAAALAYMRDDDQEDAEFDHTLDASMVFTEGAIANTDVREANKVLTRRLKVMFQISTALASTKDKNELLQKILDQLFEAFPQATRGLILTGNAFDELHPDRVLHRHGSADQKIPWSKTIAREAYCNKKSILTEDAASDYDGAMSLVQLQLNSLMCVPMLFLEECLGVIQLDTKDRSRRFTPDDLTLLTVVAGQAAMFLKNKNETTARANMQRYFSPELAESLVNGKIDLNPGGEKKTGTVFFSDIIGFTKMSSTMTPMEVITKINRYFKIMVDIIFRHKGYIDKFGGDAIMAVWGVPAETDDEALLAVTAAVEMQNALYLFNRELIDEGQNHIQMGIGLNSGSFIAGNLGSEQRMEYTVIGDQVNLAQRVESMAGRGNVFISQSVYDRAEGRMLAFKLLPTRVKGVPDEVTMYSVRGVPTKDSSVYLVSLPFVLTDHPEDEGLLVKVKKLTEERAIALILMDAKTSAKEVSLRFLPQECDPFELTFHIQREVPIPSQEGRRGYNGYLEIKDSVIATLLDERLVVTEKKPDDMPRLRTLTSTTTPA